MFPTICGYQYVVFSAPKFLVLPFPLSFTFFSSVLPSPLRFTVSPQFYPLPSVYLLPSFLPSPIIFTPSPQFYPLPLSFTFSPSFLHSPIIFPSPLNFTFFPSVRPEIDISPTIVSTVSLTTSPPSPLTTVTPATESNRPLSRPGILELYINTRDFTLLRHVIL